MATRIYAINPGDNSPAAVKENVGPTATSAIVALVVDIATTGVTEGSGTRGPNREEVLLALEKIKDYIFRDNSWPPA